MIRPEEATLKNNANPLQIIPTVLEILSSSSDGLSYREISEKTAEKFSPKKSLNVIRNVIGMGQQLKLIQPLFSPQKRMYPKWVLTNLGKQLCIQALIVQPLKTQNILKITHRFPFLACTQFEELFLMLSKANIDLMTVQGLALKNEYLTRNIFDPRYQVNSIRLLELLTQGKMKTLEIIDYLTQSAIFANLEHYNLIQRYRLKYVHWAISPLHKILQGLENHLQFLEGNLQNLWENEIQTGALSSLSKKTYQEAWVKIQPEFKECFDLCRILRFCLAISMQILQNVPTFIRKLGQMNFSNRPAFFQSWIQTSMTPLILKRIRLSLVEMQKQNIGCIPFNHFVMEFQNENPTFEFSKLQIEDAVQSILTQYFSKEMYLKIPLRESFGDYRLLNLKNMKFTGSHYHVIRWAIQTEIFTEDFFYTHIDKEIDKKAFKELLHWGLFKKNRLGWTQELCFLWGTEFDPFQYSSFVDLFRKDMNTF